LENPEDAGQFRTSEDEIIVVDRRDNTVLHNPPDAKELPERIKRICKFANENIEKSSTPTPLRAIVLHFMLAYDHPFVDGNGRTARALFYWMMAKSGYWMIRYISISRVLKKEFGQYKSGFLYVETDDNDLTYFFIHQFSVIKKAINHLNDYLKTKSQEIESTKKLLEGKRKFAHKLNYRQLSLIKHALEHPNFTYTIEGYKNTHKIVYQTARMDLLALSEKCGLLKKEKFGKTFIFVSPSDLKKRITKNLK